MRTMTVLGVAAIIALGVGNSFAADSGYPPEWKSLDISGVVGKAFMYNSMGAYGESGLKQVAACVAERYATAAASQSVNWDDWLNLVLIVGKYLPPDVQGSMATSIQQAYFPDHAAVGNTDLGKVGMAAATFDGLGRQDLADPLYANFVGRADELQNMPSGGMRVLARALWKTGARGQAARLALIQQVTSKFIVGNDQTKAVKFSHWLDIIGSLADDLPTDTRAAWVARFHQAYASTPEALAGLDNDSAFSLVGILQNLQDPTVDNVVIGFVTNGQNWKSASSQQLLLIARIIGPSGDRGRTARILVGQQLTGYLSDSTKLKSISLSNWHEFSGLVALDLPDDVRQQLSSKLLNAFVLGDGVHVQINVDNLRMIADTFRNLGVTRCSGYLASAVEKDNIDWQNVDPAGLAWLVQTMREQGETNKAAKSRLIHFLISTYSQDASNAKKLTADQWKIICQCLSENGDSSLRATLATNLHNALLGSKDALLSLNAKDLQPMLDALETVDAQQGGDVLQTVIKPSLQEFESSWQGQFNQGLLGWDGCAAVAAIMMECGETSKAQGWAIAAYQAALGTEDARAKSDDNILTGISSTFRSCGLTGKNKGYPEMALAVAYLGVNGKLSKEMSWRWPDWAELIGTPECLQHLQANLEDAQHEPNEQLAGLIAYVHRQSGDLGAWKQTLDSRIADKTISDDARAQWMLARAYAESVTEGERSPLRGKQWLDQALATAQSADLQLKILRQIVEGYEEIGRHDAAVSLLDSVRGQFAAASTAAALDALRSNILHDSVTYQAQQQASVDQQREFAERAYRADLKMRLAKAVKNGDTAEADRLKRILGMP